jgi:hypothetical protein
MIGTPEYIVTCRIILQPCVAQPCETGGGASRNAA